MSAEPIHHRTDLSLRLILIVAGGLVLGVAAALAVAGGLYVGHPAGVPPPQPGGRDGRFQDGPEQRTSIEADQEQVRQDVRAHLEGYGWVDRPAGIVRIPIERAMELEAERQGAK